MNINKHEMSDDELDNLFRESAEKIDFDFDPESWNKMNQKLDAALLSPPSSQGENSWIKRSLLLLIGLITIIGGYVFFKPTQNTSTEISKSKTEANKKESSNSNTKLNVTTVKVDTDNLSIQKTEENLTNESTKRISDTEIKAAQTSSAKSKEIYSEKNDNPSTASSKIEKALNKVVVANEKKAKLSQGKEKRNIQTASFSNSVHDINLSSTKNKVPSKNNSIGIGTVESDVKAETGKALPVELSREITTNEQSSRLNLSNFDYIAPKGTFIPSKILIPTIIFDNKEEPAKAIPQSTAKSFQKGLYFRLGFSPDLSIVSTDEITKLGSNTAILLEYRINHRLSVQGGVLRSMKYYDSYPQYYQWPYNWSSPPKMININATCKMLDIPVNLRYDITKKTQSRWFVSGGVTSYVMLKEKYIYNYENPNDPSIKWHQWEGKTGTYYAGVLNFSAGYEYQLFKKLTIQAEPLVKIPIARVGFGKVNLSTLGVLFSVKYPLYLHK